MLIVSSLILSGIREAHKVQAFTGSRTEASSVDAFVCMSSMKVAGSNETRDKSFNMHMENTMANYRKQNDLVRSL